ncbi:MAG: hypothetical protein Q4F95_12000 [Oscillospiraceae bacterium]|nr:hypothetical protein [Oscillospiraceae bacterium]
MIGITAKDKQTEAFKQVAVDITRLIHFGGYEVISDIVDMSAPQIPDIKKYFDENPDMLPDNPYELDANTTSDLYRVNKINDLTYDIEYDFVHGEKKSYMSLCMRFTHDAVEPYTTVEIQQIRNNNSEV